MISRDEFLGEVDRGGRDPQLLAKNFILNLSTWETRNGRDRWPEEERFIHLVDEIFIQRLIRKKKLEEEKISRLKKPILEKDRTIVISSAYVYFRLS